MALAWKGADRPELERALWSYADTPVGTYLVSFDSYFLGTSDDADFDPDEWEDGAWTFQWGDDEEEPVGPFASEAAARKAAEAHAAARWVEGR